MRFTDFVAVQNYLNSLINYEHEFPVGGKRNRPKLESTYSAADRLGLSLDLQNCLHIAGTKGKGSVVTMLETLLAEDLPTLSFTSPHLVSVKERIRLNGEPLADEIWQQGFSEIVSMLEKTPAIKLTYFEAGFIFFLWAAQHLNTRVHIVEAGLGGKWDATNVLKNTIAVLTLVDYDHTHILGDTLTKIATDKGGIIKPGAWVVMGLQPEEAALVYQQTIAEQGATAFIYGRDFQLEPGLVLPLTGVHQQQNAAIAIQAAKLIDPQLTQDIVRARLAHCVIPGRQQLLKGKRDILLDVAHNPVSFQALAASIQSNYANKRILAVIGMSKDKDARNAIASLQHLVTDVIVVKLNNPRSFSVPDLLTIVSDLGFNPLRVQSQEEAFSLMHESPDHDLGLVVGSFYLAGDYLEWRQRAGIA